MRSRGKVYWSQAATPARIVFAGAAAALLVALAFEKIGGYAPCPLCLQQRYAYYLALPAAGFAAFFLARGLRPNAAAALLALVALAFAANAGLGFYHSGIEWGWWPGPDSCAVAQGGSSDGRGFLDDLARTRVIRCDQAPWRLAGLSFAGWNVLISLALAAVAAAGALRRA